MKKQLALAALSAAFVVTAAQADLTEGFDDITTLEGAGWFFQNNSNPGPGTASWFQGNSAVFGSHSGDPTSYIGVNFNSGTGFSTLSNWMLTPELTIQNGDVISFYTRTVTANTFPDRLQIRLSTNGSSTDVGAGAFDVGDFTTLLLDINPNYENGGVYPEDWTEFQITVSGLGSPVQGRVAFRYFVEEGGPAGNRSNYIGIDTFSYTQVPAPGALALLGLAGLAARRRRRA